MSDRSVLDRPAPRRFETPPPQRGEPHLTADLLRSGWDAAKAKLPRLQEAENRADRSGALDVGRAALQALAPESGWEVPLMALGGGAKAIKPALVASGLTAGTSEAQAGPLSMLLRGGGKTASRNTPKAGPGVDIQGFHWSHEPKLQATSPAMYGRGIKGEEASRLADAPDVRDRSYYYTDELRKEPGLGQHQYTGTLPNIYPAGDAQRLMAAARESAAITGANPLTEFERAVKHMGFKGYESGPDKAAVVFEPVHVRAHKQGTSPQPPQMPRAKISDTTEVRPGTRTGIVTTPEQDAKRMKWLEADKTYEKLGMKPDVSTETGYYKPPGGVVERNPVRVSSVDSTPENEQVVDTVNVLRNLMLGQNARAYGGVAEEGAGGLRIGMSGQTQPQVEQVLERLGAEGGYAAPGGLDTINFGRFNGNEDEALKMAQAALDDAGVPHAKAYAGAPRSEYDEFDWTNPGQGDLTMEYLMPRLLRDPELVKRLDLTGEPQQLARGLNATAGGSASHTESAGPAAVRELNSTIASGGLAGLIQRIARGGRQGLPAVAGAATLPGLLREEQPAMQ